MPPLSMAEHTPTPSSSSTLPAVVTNTLPLLPEIQSTQIWERIFTHSSLIREAQGLAHIGDQVVSLAVTDLIQGHYPRLRVGPTSKLRDRIKCGDSLAEITVQYGLHESLRTQTPSLKASQSVQVDVFKAYVGGIFREQGMDVVKQWLDPLFGPRLDVAYRDERRDHLVVGPAAPATTPRTPNSGRKRRRTSLQDGASGDRVASTTLAGDCRVGREGLEEAASVEIGWRDIKDMTVPRLHPMASSLSGHSHRGRI
ncbi:ribonuclease III domain-containing protein [Lactarius akahatsu]|uniref:Ribonuclease III domain-containing protein n=1 Tax=Lactarius akahatsu TaxID=416441 RepID=A0AAD4QEV7_9AGAM|nr:ribonuclease III domain-containing protein [Lactarius akahatsu]